MKRIAYFAIMVFMSSLVLVGCGEKQIENLAILLNNTKPENIPGYGYGYGYGQNVSKQSWKDKIFRR